MQDGEIIELYFSRNENAIRETSAKYGKLAMSIAYNILRSPEDAEECVNDTYLGAWNSIPPARPNNLRAFICKIARNLSLDKLKYNTAAKRSPELTVSLSELEEVISDDKVSDSGELSDIISAFLRLQKPDARNVFIRRYWFNESSAEIAERYSFSESKVKSILFHTRNRLREYLRKEGFDV